MSGLEVLAEDADLARHGQQNRIFIPMLASGLIAIELEQ